MSQAYDQVTGKFVFLPEGWAEEDDRAGDVVRTDGNARVIMTGPHGRYAAQEWTGHRWVQIRKPGASSNSYFRNLLSCITHADEHRRLWE